MTAELYFFQDSPGECCSCCCSYKVHNIHRKSPVLKSLFNKVAGLQAASATG